MRKIKQTLCLLLSAILLGASLCMPAAAEEPERIALQLENVVVQNSEGTIVPYATYIQSVLPSVYKTSSTTLCFEATVNTYGDKLTYKGTVTVRKKVGGMELNIMSESQSYYGTGPFTYRLDNYTYTPGAYACRIKIEVYNGNTLLESETVDSSYYQF